MQLTSLQLRILVKLATPGRMTVERLLVAAMPRKLDINQRPLLEAEILLQIDLLALHGLITVVDQSGERYCIAPSAVVRLLAKNQPRASRGARKKSMPFVLPVITASLMSAAGCTHTPSTTAAAPAPVVTRYNAEGTPPPERMEQFYNRRTGNMVYRFCVGSECPEPTPKRPLQRRSVVTEINPDGTTEPVAQIAAPQPEQAQAKASTTKPKAAAAKNDNGASLLQAPAAKTAATDKTAAAVAAQLNTLKPAVQGSTSSPPPQAAAAIGAAAAAAAAAAPKQSGKGGESARPVASTTAKPLPKVDEEAPVVVPTVEKPMRIPSSPSARATPLDTGAKVMQTAFTQPKPTSVGNNASTSNNVVASSVGTSSAEQFVAVWARLWSDKATDAYFSLYAPDFWPTYGTVRDVAAWKNQRRSVMERQGEIKVTVDVVKVIENEEKAAVRFWQNYESPSFRSRVLKVVDLAKADGEWKIRRERLIPVETPTVSA